MTWFHKQGCSDQVDTQPLLTCADPGGKGEVFILGDSPVIDGKTSAKKPEEGGFVRVSRCVF